jgi:hypothetical protein
VKHKINRDMEDDKGEGERKRNVKISRQQHFPDFVFHITYKKKKKGIEQEVSKTRTASDGCIQM